MVHLCQCLTCRAEYRSAVPLDGLCPRCQGIEDAEYAQSVHVDLPVWKYARPAMRERLGVIGDRDE